LKFIIAIICLRNNLFISIFIWILLILSYISFLQNWWRRRQLMQVKILHYLDNITKGNKNYIYYLNDIAENINIEAIYYYHHKNNLFLRMLQNWSKQRPTNRTLYQNYYSLYYILFCIQYWGFTFRVWSRKHLFSRTMYSGRDRDLRFLSPITLTAIIPQKYCWTP
jgi:hypothetical protein